MTTAITSALLPRISKQLVPGVFGTLELLPEPPRQATSAGAASPGWLDLSDDQAQVAEGIMRWIEKDKEKLLTLGGYAGTGKTTVVSLIAKEIMESHRPVFCAYTGRAASILRGKLLGAGLAPTYCGTIHGLIKDPIVNERTGQVMGWIDKPEIPGDLIVIDEGSMLDQDLYADLARYNKKMLVVGDHGQLPPVKGSSNMMTSPQLRLEKIHRQAEESPIIRLSARVREQGIDGIPRDQIRNIRDCLPELAESFKQSPLECAALCWSNKDRVEINRKLRAMVHGAEPVESLKPKDLLVCLKNTRFGLGKVICNGTRGQVSLWSGMSTSLQHKSVGIDVPDEAARLLVGISRPQIGRASTFKQFSDLLPEKIYHWDQVGMLWDWGWCLTVHKAQGSQFERVMVKISRPHPDITDDECRRWLYTAITRASKELVLVR